MNNRRNWRQRGGNRNRGGNFRGRRGARVLINSFDSPFVLNNDVYQQNPRQSWRQGANPQRQVMTKRLSEDKIGVTEYISDHEGFNGIIKSRYSDFQVSEINMNGEVAKLTNLKAPELPEDKSIDEDEDLLLSKYNLEILPMETWDNINSLAVANQPIDKKVEIDVTGMSKEDRTKIHDAVKKAFGKSIVGSTVTIEDKKYVRFEKFRKGIRIDKRVKWLWPAEYVYFVVHKENCDTMEAAIRITERLKLNLKPAMLGYAGTKDRRAKTSQWFSLRKVDPRKIAAACQDLRDIHVGNYSFSSDNLKLGMLKGNRFRIALRNVTASDEVVSRACEQLRRGGFINYYGLQRFGTRLDAPTYHIGLKLFQGNYKEAIESLLEPREGPLQHALRLYAAAGPLAAWRACPKHMAAPEARVLRALAHDPADLLAAIEQIPRNTRLLYIHSYQSLVWNRVVSARLKKLGYKPAVGDLVPLTPIQHIEYVEESEDSENEDGDTDSQRDKESTAEKKKGESENKEKKDDKIVKEERKEVLVKILTQEDIDSNKYTIFDIVLPLPGQCITYPPNMVDYYKELLTKDGLHLEMKHRLKNFSMSGAYRHAVVRPRELAWRCARYSAPLGDLLLSDRDELRGCTRTAILDDGKYKALLLTMTLPTSCYATMALRELLKVDTSCDNQASQNNYHKTDTQKSNESENGEKQSENPDKQSENPDKQNENPDKQSENPDNQSENEEKMESENSAAVEKRKLDSDVEVSAKKVKQDEA